MLYCYTMLDGMFAVVVVLFGLDGGKWDAIPTLVSFLGSILG